MNNQKVTPARNPVYKISHLFEGLSELELNMVLSFLEPRRLKKGEAIFEEGVAGKEMFIIISGTIGAWVSQADGTQRWMFELKTGDFFGEMSIIANESRSATLIAQSDTELLALQGKDFYHIIYEYPMIGVKILKVIGKVQNTWLEQTSKNLNDLMRWGETARRRSVTDELTELYNRRFLDECAKIRFEYSSVGARIISLIMMDLDKIHEVNSRYGTKAGDLVIISSANVLHSYTRTGDICARLSGDEFAVLLPDTEHEEARLIAERICKAMVSLKVAVPKSPDSEEQTEVSISTSIGIASAPLHANTWENLVSAANDALSHAKELGRNRVEVAK